MHLIKSSIVILLTMFSTIVAAAELALDFSGTELRDERTIHLADYRGKVVFIDFWASWCPPCLLSLPAYEKMRKEIDSEEFEIIAINVDEQTQDGLDFLEDHPVSYPMLADPEGDIGIPYGIRSLPMSFLVDRNGLIVQSYRSFKAGDETSLKQEIEKLLLQ